MKTLNRLFCLVPVVSPGVNKHSLVLQTRFSVLHLIPHLITCSFMSFNFFNVKIHICSLSWWTDVAP